MDERGDLWLIGGAWQAVSGPARMALERAVEEVGRGGVVALPRLRLVPGAMVARWVYRRWRDAGGQGALEEVDRAHLAAAGRRSGVGMVYVSGEADPARLAALIEGPVARVVVDGEEEHDVPLAVVVGIEQLDDLHGVAIDPALATARATLLQHCRAGRAVRLVGSDPMVGARLARWAHLVCSPEVPCRVYRHGDEEPVGRDGWRIYEGVGELPERVRQQLRVELARREAIRSLPHLRPPGPLVARPDDPRLADQVGHSEALVRLLRETLAAAPIGEDVRRATVHITGPTGSGKEAVANALHALSGRKGKMVARDLAAVPDTAASAELFGTAEGAFTDVRDRVGLFEQADGGTLFLDEIANIPRDTQQELLRVLETRVVRRVGGKADVPVNVRVITATSADLDERVDEGRFLPDLLHRLRPRVLRVPSLAERREDIEELARHLLPREVRVDPAALLALMRHAWPGNVRELRNELEQARLRAEGGTIRVSHLGITRPPLPVLLVGAPDDLAPVKDLPVVHLSARSGDPDDAPGGRTLADPASLPHVLAHLWPGGLPGLLDAASRAGSGACGPFAVVDSRAQPSGEAPREPLLVVQGPLLSADGAVAGLVAPVAEDAVLIGRGLGEVLRAWGGAPGAEDALDAACLARLRWLRERLGSRPPAAASLEAFDHLSRGHVLVQRSGRGLLVSRLPHTRYDVVVGLVEEERHVALPPGGEVLTGQIARVTVSRGDRPSAELWFCAGLEAFAELGEWLRPHSPEDTVGPEGERPRPAAVWRVTPPQRDAMVDLAVGFLRSGVRSFAASLATQLPGLAARPELADVAHFVNVPEPSHRLKNYARLLSYAPNAEVVDALAAALAGIPPGYVETLPAQVLRLVRPRLRPEAPG